MSSVNKSSRSGLSGSPGPNFDPEAINLIRRPRV